MLNKQFFQVRINSLPWADVELSHDNLSDIVAATQSSLVTRYPEKALPELYEAIIVANKARTSLDPQVYDIINLVFDTSVIVDDVLRISYTFQVRFGDDTVTEKAIKARAAYNRRNILKRADSMLMADKEPKTVTGTITILPST
jgi:hypothetical protein